MISSDQSARADETQTMRIVDLRCEDLKMGMSAELVWDVTKDDIDRFAAVSGDVNPLHLDAAYAREHGFRDRVAHGFLLGSKVSAFIGTVLPGRRCLLLEQSLSFPNAIFAGDRISIIGEIAELWPDQKLLRLKIRATKRENDKSVAVGRGWVLCRIQS